MDARRSAGLGGAGQGTWTWYWICPRISVAMARKERIFSPHGVHAMMRIRCSTKHRSDGFLAGPSKVLGVSCTLQQSVGK